jgi:hypothetical protein
MGVMGIFRQLHGKMAFWKVVLFFPQGIGMGIRRLQFAALLLLSLCFVVAQEPAANKKSPYEDMIEKIRAGDASVNFRQLWLAYVAFQVRNPRKDTEPQKQAMNQALRDEDYKRALEKAEGCYWKTS